MATKTIRLCLFVMLLLAFSTAVAATHLTKLSICDKIGGTALVQNKVTVCAGQKIYKVLDSTQLLAQTNAKPFTDKEHTPHVTFLYSEPAPGAKKAVKAIITQDVTPQKLSFPLSFFSLNFVFGKPLMLTFDGEYYLLANSSLMELFSFEKTKLVHVPTGKEFTPQIVQGTNWYVFETLGQKKIAAGIFEAEVIISPLEQGEVPAAYVKPYNLTQLHEVQFTFNTPVKIIDPSPVGQLAICQLDNPADTQQAVICRNNVEQFTLKKDVLTTRTLDGKDYAFLYEYAGNEKQISLFKIQDVSRSMLKLDEHLDLAYNDFIDGMIAGRRIAIKFNNNLYLLKHPISLTISLLDLVLTAYQEAGTTTLAAVGGEDAVEFTGLKGEKIFLQRNYGTPPPPFELNGRSVEELEPANLDEQLFTSLSSTGAITIVNPAFGKLTAAADDTKLYQPTFKIFSAGKNQAYTLSYMQPLVADDSTLFYYHTAEISGSTPIKTTSIYRYYNLASGPKARPFNDVFIATFTGGKELALQYKGNYYLLGHKGNPNAVKFYDPAQLTLRYLNGTEDFQVSVEGGIGKFTIPGGRIDVSVNVGAGTISFSATTAQEATAVAFIEYMTELTAENFVKVGDLTLQLCFQQLYASLPSAKVCDLNKKMPDLVVDPVISLTPAFTIAGKKYILESNGQVGDNKKVFIRSLLELKKGEQLPADFKIPPVPSISWTKFIDDVLDKKHPVFNLSGVLYMPSAKDSKLESLSFALFPAGTPQNTITNLQQLTPVSFNGTFILGDALLLVEQKETDQEELPLKVSFIMPKYSYLPENGAPVSINTSTGISELSFVTKLAQSPFDLKVVEFSGAGALVKLSLQSGSEIFFNRWFAEGEVREMTVTGAHFEVKVKQVDKDKKSATIMVRRL